MIIMASDHRGYWLKEELKTFFNQENIITIDVGTYSKEPVDYPDYAKLGIEKILENKNNVGIFICGSGIGMSIACNKVRHVRCAKVNNVHEVEMTRRDNDANVITMGEQTPTSLALEMVDTFLNTPFMNIERYQKRVKEIDEYDN